MSRIRRPSMRGQARRCRPRQTPPAANQSEDMRKLQLINYISLWHHLKIQANNFAYPFVELEVLAPSSYPNTDRLMSQRFQQADLAVLRDILVSSNSDHSGMRLNTPEPRRNLC